MRILGIDPGEKNIGVAISDPTRTIAQPLMVIKHESRIIDAGAIAQVALENDAHVIVVGQALDLDGKPSLAGRRAARLAAAVRAQTDIPVILWDESYSTQEAQRVGVKLNLPRRKRRGHMDEIAATVILQTYLDSQPLNSSSS